MAATMITDDKMFCCGSFANKTAQIYDFKTKALTKVNDMNEERRYHGICHDTYNDEKVYVGGGWETPKKFEYYDIRKNKWTLLSDSRGEHAGWPIIWNDDVNIIHIASTIKCKIFERLDIRENKWRSYITKDNNNFDNIFGVTVYDDNSSRLLIGL